MSIIKKFNMASKAKDAAQKAPSIQDRLTHAQNMVEHHPAPDTPVVGTRSAPPVQAVPVVEEGARLVHAPLDLIDPNPFNARQIYLPERAQKLAASLGTHGQEVPGTGTYRNGRYILAAGHYRLRGLKICGAKTMAIMITDGLTDKQLYEQSYRENVEREEQTPLDDALSWSNLLKTGVYRTETDIAEATGQSQSNVNRILSVLKVSPATLEIIKEAPKGFKLSVLSELAQYEAVAGQEKGTQMARRVLSDEIGRKEIIEARKALGKPIRKSKETSRQYKIQSEGKPVGVIKDWDSGRVSLDVVLSDPRERAAVVAELRERFGVLE